MVFVIHTMLIDTKLIPETSFIFGMALCDCEHTEFSYIVLFFLLSKKKKVIRHHSLKKVLYAMFIFN